MVGLVVSKKDIDLAKSIVKINHPYTEIESNIPSSYLLTSGSILK